MAETMFGRCQVWAASGDGPRAGETCWGTRHYGAPAVVRVGAGAVFPREVLFCAYLNLQNADGQAT